MGQTADGIHSEMHARATGADAVSAVYANHGETLTALARNCEPHPRKGRPQARLQGVDRQTARMASCQASATQRGDNGNMPCVATTTRPCVPTGDWARTLRGQRKPPS